MEEYLQQIANALVECEEYPVDREDMEDGADVVSQVEGLLKWYVEARQEARGFRGGNEELQRRLKTCQEQLAAAERKAGQFEAQLADAGVTCAKMRAERDTAITERETAFDLVEERAREAARLRNEAANWQQRYIGMTSALTIAVNAMTRTAQP